MKSFLIVEDEKVTRKGIVYLLQSTIDNCKISEAQNGEEAIEQMKDQKFDLVVTDISMPKMDGIELLKEIRNLWITQKVLVLTMMDSEEPLKKMLAIGVDGYLIKNSAEVEILTAIERIMAGKKYFPPKVTEKAIDNLPKTPPVKRVLLTQIHNLSNTEKEVMEMIANGIPVNEIASLLSLPYNVISLAILRIREKTKTRTDQELIEFAQNFEK